MMQNVSLMGMKSLDQLRSSKGSTIGNARTVSPMNARFSSDSVGIGAFTNLKLTAEKLVKEQASVKTDLEMANSKLKKSSEQVQLLETKLREAINENAKMTVKHREDAKLWNGLDSKLSFTKMLCDQLIETLQRLAGVTQDAEKDKKHIEEKLVNSSKSFDDLKCQFIKLSEKLDNAEKIIETGKQDIFQLEDTKKEIEIKLKEESSLNHNLMTERDAIVKQLKDEFDEHNRKMQVLNSQLGELQREVESKDIICRSLQEAMTTLENERNALKSFNEDLSLQSSKSLEETRNLENGLQKLASDVKEMDQDSLKFSKNISQLLTSFEYFESLVEKERNLAAQNAQVKFDEIHHQLQNATAENEHLKCQIVTMTGKSMELQKAQEFLMVQHADECHLVEEKIRKIESQSDAIVLKNDELESLVSQLKEKNSQLVDSLSHADKQLEDFQLDASKLECEVQDLKNKIQLMLLEKSDIAILQNTIETQNQQIETQNQQIETLETEISELKRLMEDKDKTTMHFCEREKLLEEQKTEIQESLVLAESRLSEARKQYDLMFESKQAELSKHLKEISQRNDQAINEIRKKYETEKLEILSIEKEKMNKLVTDTERKCEDRIRECKEDEQQHLLCLKQEHDASMKQIRQEFEVRESKLRAFHLEEMQRVQLQSDSELREKMTSMRREHEMQMQVLRHQLEDDCKKLQEELELIKSKEEKQRSLLQLQWKAEKSHQNDFEVNSKKEYSVSSRKRRDLDIANDTQISMNKQENGRKELGDCDMGTPVVNMFKKMKKGTKGDSVNIPKHSKKVTHHEYEIETSNGRTITKRRKTKSTVMFGEPGSHKRVNVKTPTATPNDKMPTKPRKSTRERSSAIGDLFSEASLNPYAEDPYAFD